MISFVLLFALAFAQTTVKTDEMIDIQTEYQCSTQSGVWKDNKCYCKPETPHINPEYPPYGKCQATCAPGTEEQADKTCKKCSENTDGKIFYNDHTKKCVSECTEGTTEDETLFKRCKCQTDDKIIYNPYATTTEKCVANCPFPMTVKDGKCLKCSDNAGEEKLYDEAFGVCVKDCPAHTTKNDATKVCERTCKGEKPLFNQMKTGDADKCVAACPVGSTKKYQYDDNDLTEAKKNAYLCYKECYTTDYPNYDPSLKGEFKCVKNCPTKTEAVNGVCTACPADKKFYDEFDRKCLAACPAGKEAKDGICVTKTDTTNPSGVNGLFLVLAFALFFLF